MILYSLGVGLLKILFHLTDLSCIKTHTLYTNVIGPTSVIVDLGANVGDFSRQINAQFGCECYAVEAVPAVFNQIESSDKIHKYNLAISDSESRIQIFTSQNREAHSIHKSIAEAFRVDNVIECPSMRLEQFIVKAGIEKIDVLKVDIEGAELLLFQSTSDSTLSLIGQLTVEFHDFIPGSITAAEVTAICNRLKKLGFFLIPASYIYSPELSTCDFLFINRKVIQLPWSHSISLRWSQWILRAIDLRARITFFLKSKLVGKKATPVSAAGN